MPPANGASKVMQNRPRPAVANAERHWRELQSVSAGYEVEEKLVNVVDVKADDSQEEQHSAPSETQSTTSRSTYQMPPPFVPASNQSAMASESNPISTAGCVQCSTLQALAIFLLMLTRNKAVHITAIIHLQFHQWDRAPYRGVIGYPRKEEIPWAAGNRRDLWFHLREQFAQPEFSDCVLELRYSDDRAPPLQISGHRLIFSRSLVLKGLITSGAQANCHSPQTNQNILIESDDRYLRSDAFSLAVRYLYGGPILDLDAMARFPAPYIGSAPIPSTPPAERFNFTLGYVASGVVLQIPQIWKTGCSIASQLITWDTAEKALEFALEGGIDWSWSSGNPDVNDVIDPIITTLSRLLLNLPFGPLKHVLESGNSGLIHGQATHLLRRKIMYPVIEEREKRRQRAFASKVPYDERVKNGRQWNVVGWKEAVLPFDDHRNEEVLCLRKTWVGFTQC
ncbi:hypothetical protein DID88_007630 [Monilinia fructigena]|uniref:BTB domain-containing protein n=1 Tax=Monilinia fructigena TaxID=38457 RepID=A0A395J2V2_9HELO|nr:hypothetical protein DID88_007630 [Monilinia fructigena]